MYQSNKQNSCRAVRRDAKQARIRGQILSLLVFITALLIAASSDAAVHIAKTSSHEPHNIEQVMLRNALVAFSREDYQRAHARLVPLAQKGHADAQFYLAVCTMPVMVLRPMLLWRHTGSVGPPNVGMSMHSTIWVWPTPMVKEY